MNAQVYTLRNVTRLSTGGWTKFSADNSRPQRCPPADDYWSGWLHDAEHINALSQPVRSYVHDVVTNAGPAGMIAENTILRDMVGSYTGPLLM
jgi:hypothetical protein